MTMTIKELLDSVTFDEVFPHLINICGYKVNLGWYKIHFDRLRMLPPLRQDDEESVCVVCLKNIDDLVDPYIYFKPGLYSMSWEHVLTMTIHLNPDVNLSNVELAAYCLNETCTGRYDILYRYNDYDNKNLQQNVKTIYKYGGYVPSLRDWSPALKAILVKNAKRDLVYLKPALYGRCNRSKSKKLFRFWSRYLYNIAIWNISSFIIYAYSALGTPTHDLNITKLCRLFHTERFFMPVRIRSYADGTTTGAYYIMELIDKYHILDIDQPDKSNGIVLVIKTGRVDKRLTASEDKLCNRIIEDYEHGDIIYATDSSLGKQVEICFINYESKENLLDNNSIFVGKPLLASTIKEILPVYSNTGGWRYDK